LKTSKVATITINIAVPTDYVDKVTMKRSIMPNFIHSLDAANVHLVLVSMSDRSLPVYIILDCFASTANNMKKNVKLVKAAFIDILLLRSSKTSSTLCCCYNK